MNRKDFRNGPAQEKADEKRAGRAWHTQVRQVLHRSRQEGCCFRRAARETRAAKPGTARTECGSQGPSRPSGRSACLHFGKGTLNVWRQRALGISSRHGVALGKVRDAGRGITGVRASLRGLRHSFGVTAVTKGIPLNIVQRLLGHASITTTTIYTEASGPEERAIVSRFWS